MNARTAKLLNRIAVQLGKPNARPMKRLWRTMTSRQRARQRRRLIAQAEKHEAERRDKANNQ